MNRSLITVSLLACLPFAIATAQPPDSSVMDWTIDGVKRQAVVIPPAQRSDGGAPVMLVFHGHGGTMRLMQRKGFQKHWPEAIVVCPQGLPTKTPNDPEGKRPGWQHRQGEYNDRDLKFVDAILKTLRGKYKVDDKRIYATGHSNGGVFTYLLWTERGQELAAIAPSSGPAVALLRGRKEPKPLPILHLAGEKDEIVSFASQKRTMDAVRKILGCEAEGKAWAKAGSLTGTLYASAGGTPFVSLIHPGTHRFPDEAPELIVRFFREHAKR